MLRIEADRARVAMMASYQAVTDDVGKLPGDELARPSRCQGWSRAGLLFHMLLDAQRALVTFATPAAANRTSTSSPTGCHSGPAPKVMPGTPGSSGG